MIPIATFHKEEQVVEVIDGEEHISLRMEVVDAIFQSLLDDEDEITIYNAEAVYYPVGIGAIPTDGELRVIIDMEAGHKHVFAFPAPGMSIERVRGAADSLKECFQRLFAPQ